jgi:hypothetical protein
MPGGEWSARYSIPCYIAGIEKPLAKLRQKGTEFGRYLIRKKSQTADVNGKSLPANVKSTFIPHVMKVRIDKGIGEQEAVRLIDNCPCHVTRDVMNLPTAATMWLVTFAPHTMQIFQLLDLTLFLILRPGGEYHLLFHELMTTINLAYHVDLQLAQIFTT